MSKANKKRQTKKKHGRKYRAQADRAEARAKKARQPRQPQRVLSTANAKIIHGLMTEKGVKGDPKDYVILVGNRLIIWNGAFEVKSEDGQTFGVDGMALIHRRNLANIIGEEARRFWHPQFGRVMDVPPATKPGQVR